MTIAADDHDTSAGHSVSEAELAALVSDLMNEMCGAAAGWTDVRPSSRLDRDLGIDSLGRTELTLRIARRFAVPVPVSVMGQIDKVGDLLAAVNRGGVSPVLPRPAAIAAW